jgi:Protein of unknown function (DUF3307)
VHEKPRFFCNPRQTHYPDQSLLAMAESAHKRRVMMFSNSTLLAPFLLVSALQVKHVICDGPLQTLAMVREKSRYMRPLGIAHAAIHGAGTVLILSLFKFDPTISFFAGAVEFLLHYHIDYVKENVVKLFGWTTATGPFWWVLTFDQALHHFTYLAMGLLLFRL